MKNIPALNQEKRHKDNEKTQTMRAAKRSRDKGMSGRRKQR